MPKEISLKMFLCLRPAAWMVVLAAGWRAASGAGVDRHPPAGENTVARNDVVYSTPSVEPWEAMPTGGGDLSAMVRFDGDLHLHLTKSDAWGFQAPPDAKPGSRFFNNVSPGHVRIIFGRAGKEAAKRYFRQRLDLYHGRIVIDLGDEEDPARFVVWGHPARKVLVVEAVDPRSILPEVSVELSQWRDTMKVGAVDGVLHAREVYTRPARPHLANTGMQNYFDEAHDPLKGRGTAVAVGVSDINSTSASVGARTTTMSLSDRHPPRFHLIIATAVTPSGSGHDPLAVARQELDEASRLPLDTLRAEPQAWWSNYWDRSFLQLSSPDGSAERLVRAYYVHLYTLGCVNRGPVPAKWDGGAGLMRGDERNWGLAEWVQEVRFTYMPLYAANQLEIARGLHDHYFRMMPYLMEQTKTMWGIAGLWIPETVLPWGHAEDWLLKDDGRGAIEYFQPWDPKTAPYGKFERYNPYVGFLFTAGLEICHHYLTYCRFSGDEAFARDRAYPMIRGVCEFVSGLTRKGHDGRYHLDPANALETWWLVRDPSDTLDGIRAIFPEFIRLSGEGERTREPRTTAKAATSNAAREDARPPNEPAVSSVAMRRGRDAELRARCAEILAALPDPPRGAWGEDGKIDAAVDAYAPAVAKGKDPNRRNAENPALYRVYPFGLSGIGSNDYDRARRTFDRRICSLGNGWSMDAIWAARLGLGDEACRLLTEHAKRYNRFRYGGWTSNDSQVFPDRLSATPFLDAGGLSAFALQECLLQSHNGLIRVLPAVASDWSGSFQLRAENGFLVSAAFERNRQVRCVEIMSILGKPCAIANPWPAGCIVRHGKNTLMRCSDQEIRFKTEASATYTISPS